MKTQFQRIGLRLRSGSAIAGLALAAALTPSVANATAITLTPATQDVNVGDSFDLAVRITGLGDHTAPALGAFDLDVTFNASLVQYDSVAFGDPALGDLLGPVSPSANGASLSVSGDSVNLFGFSLDSPTDLNQPADFTLAILRFTALTIGSGGFDLANVVLGDANGDPLPLDATQGANINVRSHTVPEGSAGWMGALTLGAMGLGRHRLGRRQSCC